MASVCRDSLGKARGRSLRASLALQRLIMHGLRPGADRSGQRLGILGMLGRAGTDGLEVNAFGRALG